MMRKKILAIQGSKLNKVNIKTDTTLFLAIEAQKRGYKVYYFEPENLSYINGKTTAKCYCLTLFENRIFFYKIDKIFNFDLSKADVILIRNNPPFNQQYINTTFILEHVAKKVKILNHPKSIREVPEKLFSMHLSNIYVLCCNY